ncbi:MAG: hypothetical protein A3I66_18095 [Burkholderiales bacterium RIFCSPLOWO2_02_FULL_57_36]|nr:MAG: hypothetical protein A3I66_18095 [Burkholderiales bacterium RIFCSPLOWO2_02_FULL_57_36]
MIPFFHAEIGARIKLSLCAFYIVAGLSACGGGGGGGPSETGQPVTVSTLASEPPDPSPSAVITRALVISEISTTYYSNDVAWLEIYNADSGPIALSDYTLRSSYIDPKTGAYSFEPISFALPSITIPAHGYLVIAGDVYDKLQGNSQIVYVKNNSAVPYWNANGSVELVVADRSADFVRFGASMALPMTSAAWAGRNVAELPSGASEHGASIVRLASRGMPDTDTASDWTLVNFATPAGVNDIGAGVADSDRDGIPDSAKVQGGAYAGLDLYAMGARPGRRDIFIEIDYMSDADPGVTPRREALQKLVDAFAEKNIAVHLDTGNLYSQSFDPDGFNLDGGNPVKFAKCIELAISAADATPGCASFYDYKSRHFDVRRMLAFHYVLFANSQNVNGSAGSSGIAEVAGNDLIVTLGGYGFPTASASGLNLLINLQASTLMHELGHNLGLQHGGNENANYKPNHYSIMNYMYQFAGLSATPNTANAAERYFLANGLKGKTYCNLVENSPCTSAFRLSYSDGAGAVLHESGLMEAANIGHGSGGGAYADWNDDHAFNAAAYARNLNPQEGTGIAVLKDYDEWANLMLPFSRTYSGSNSGDVMSINEKKRAPRSNPMNKHARQRIAEQPLPADFQDMLRKLKMHKH